MLGPYTLRSHFPIAPLLRPAATSRSVRLRPCSLQNWSIFETFTSDSPFYSCKSLENMLLCNCEVQSE
nr:MAG TPA: hypothetical protein [Caudoviricetes sp.]